MTVDVPEQMTPWLDDITLSDEIMTDFAETSLYETLCVGCGGIMVDMPVSQENITVAQADALQIRPYLAFYKAESILNWEMARMNNAYRLVNLWLSEHLKNNEGEQEQQIRQLTLVDGVYTRLVGRQKSGEGATAKKQENSGIVCGQDDYPTKGWIAIRRNPFLSGICS